MFNILKKIIIAILLLRILAMIANVMHGPMRAIVVVALLFCGIRFVFSKDTDGGK